jgi:hypothetical protein
MASITVHVAPTDAIGPMVADRLLAAARRSPSGCVKLHVHVHFILHIKQQHAASTTCLNACDAPAALHDVDQQVTERNLLLVIRYRSGRFAEAQHACVARVSSIATLSIHFDHFARSEGRAPCSLHFHCMATTHHLRVVCTMPLHVAPHAK